MMQPYTHSLARFFKAMVMRLVGPMLFIALLAPTAWAAEPVKISSLQTYPESYKMKVVQVEGQSADTKCIISSETTPSWRNAYKILWLMTAPGRSSKLCGALPDGTGYAPRRR